MEVSVTPHTVTKEQIVARLNIEKFYLDRGVELRKSGSELVGRCPFHKDTNPSFSVNPESGLFFCHAGCGANGSVFDFVMKLEHRDFKGAFEIVAKEAGVTLTKAKPPIPEDKVREWHERLLDSKSRMSFLLERRGLNEETVKRFEIGFDGDRYTIPIRDGRGVLVNVRRYKPEATGKDKMISYAQMHEGEKHTYGTARLFPATVDGTQVVIAEGEMDCMLAVQLGFKANTGTTGAGSWNTDWNRQYADKDVVIAYDNDDAGKTGSVNVAKNLYPVAKSVRILQWPNTMLKRGDITDWFVNLGETPEAFQALLDSAILYSPPAPVAEEEVEEVSLAQASMAKYSGKPIKMRFMVSGKDTAPFIVPGKIRAWCDQDNGDACHSCGMSSVHRGKAELVFTDKDREVLGMLRTTDAGQKGMISKKLGIVARCSHWGYKAAETMNVEEVQAIPEINGNLQMATDGEYVTRTLYVMRHGIKTNTVYDVQGYTYPNVTDQRATSLLGKAEEAETSLDKFQMTPEMIERLKIFQRGPDQSVNDKLYEISGELSKYHHIYGREDLNIAYDMSWHSALAFNCFGEYQPNGRVEVFVLGDSGQGKTSMATKLSEYYRCGQRVQAEQSSGAGLIGGLTKTGDRWHISWGPVVLNDRRLLILDEWSGVAESDAEKMTDIRSTGVAEIIKIHREKAYARTRLIFLSNPKDGRPLASYEHGVEALTTLFTKMEDIRRITIAISVASGDVDPSKINQFASGEDPRYSSRDCADLVLWGWSRKPDQISISKETQDMIVSCAAALGKIYTPRIPLIEPADARWKLARVAVSAAIRTFSTEDGETVIVTPDHVLFAASYLDRVFSSRSFAYNIFSKRAKLSDDYVSAKKDYILDQLRTMTPEPKVLFEIFMTEKYLGIKELELQLGIERQEVKRLIGFLQKNKCIERTTRGFRKRPKFTEILREIEDQEGGVDRWAADPLGHAAIDDYGAPVTSLSALPQFGYDDE